MSIRLVSPAYDPDRLHGVATRILAANMLCSMATTGEHGEAHIHTAFFCYDDDLALHFLSHPASVHARNIGRSPRIAVAVFAGQQAWGAAHVGLQLFGRCEQATGNAESAVRERYAARFPLYDEFISGRLTEGGPKPGASFFDLRFYTFRPEAVKILDELEFGDEVLVSATVEPAASRA
jgi:uncharacterized protein YhbP (UPF0306 family)